MNFERSYIPFSKILQYSFYEKPSPTSAATKPIFFYLQSEYPDPPTFIESTGYQDNQTIAFSWSTNTTNLIASKTLFYNVSIMSEDGVIVQQISDIDEEKVDLDVSDLDQLTNYTLVIQSRNKYTFSKETTDFTFFTLGKIF